MGCPNQYAREVATAVNLCDLFNKGLPPVAGGVLDQSAWFIQAESILRSDELNIKYDGGSDGG